MHGFTNKTLSELYSEDLKRKMEEAQTESKIQAKALMNNPPITSTAYIKYLDQDKLYKPLQYKTI